MEDLVIEIIGHKTEKNELEDFWMARVTHLEKQYDEHMNKLEKQLFDNKFQNRIFSSLAGEKEQLAIDLNQTSKQCKSLRTKVTNLSVELDKKVKQSTVLQKKLDTVKVENIDLQKIVRDQRSSMRKATKEKNCLNHKLARFEKEKKTLIYNVSVRENELKHWRIKESEDSQKSPFIPMDDSGKISRNVVAARNYTGIQKQMNQVIQQSQTQEEKLYDMRQHLEEVIKQLGDSELEIEHAHSEKHRIQSQLMSTKEDLNQALAKLDLQKQRTEQWREEVKFRDSRLKSEVAKNEISALRGQVATLNGQLKSLELDRERYLQDRSKLNIKLQGLESLQKSLAQLTKDNVRTRNSIMKRLEDQEEAASLISISNKKLIHGDPDYGYQKQINGLEKRMKDIEGYLISSRRRENSLRWSLQKQSSNLISQIHWTNKAKFKVDIQHHESERLFNAWAQQLTQKIIPGYNANRNNLGQRAKEKILQRRLISQTSKLEKLKSQFTLKSLNQVSSSTSLDLENWKWTNFMKSSVLSEHSNASVEKQKEYIEQLGENIALLGKDIRILERKQTILSPIEKTTQQELLKQLKLGENDENGLVDEQDSSINEILSDEVLSNEESPTEGDGEEESPISSSSTTNNSSQ